MYDLLSSRHYVYIGDGELVVAVASDCPPLLTLPHSPTSTIPLGHRLHPEHLAKTLVLGDSQRLCQDICPHIIGPDQLQVDTPVRNAFPDKVVPDVNMLRCRVVDRIPGK